MTLFEIAENLSKCKQIADINGKHLNTEQKEANNKTMLMTIFGNNCKAFLG